MFFTGQWRSSQIFLWKLLCVFTYGVQENAKQTMNLVHSIYSNPSPIQGGGDTRLAAQWLHLIPPPECGKLWIPHVPYPSCSSPSASKFSSAPGMGHQLTKLREGGVQGWTRWEKCARLLLAPSCEFLGPKNFSSSLELQQWRTGWESEGSENKTCLYTSCSCVWKRELSQERGMITPLQMGKVRLRTYTPCSRPYSEWSWVLNIDLSDQNCIFLLATQP